MKRASALICALIVAVFMMAPAAFAADTDDAAADKGAAAAKTDLELVNSSPEDGATGVAVDNLSVKMRFNKDVTPASNEIRKANAKQFKMVDADGKKIPLKVYYSEKEKGLILVAADVYDGSSKNRIKGGADYTLTVGRNFQATDGSTTGQQIAVKMTTLNQGRSTAIYMLLMVLMMAGMVFFTVRSTKNAEKKKKEEREFKEGVNPFKEAKKSGKSVAEVVAKERVSAPRAISSAGSSLKLKVVNDAGHKVDPAKAKSDSEVHKSNKGTTNPKGQSGKAKNKKGKGKKKK